MAPGLRDLTEHGNGEGLALADHDPHRPGCRRREQAASSPHHLPYPSLPSLVGRARGTWLIHHQLCRTGQRKEDKGRSPETCSFHRELLQGNKAADVRNATGLFAWAARCLRQHGHASACRFKSYCCSGLGASLFPLPFRQAWSQPGIKLFKSSRRASQLNSCTERTGCDIPEGSSPRRHPPGPAQRTLVHTGSCWFPLPRGKGPNIRASDTSSPSTAVQRHH